MQATHICSLLKQADVGSTWMKPPEGESSDSWTPDFEKDFPRVAKQALSGMKSYGQSWEVTRIRPINDRRGRYAIFEYEIHIPNSSTSHRSFSVLVSDLQSRSEGQIRVREMNPEGQGMIP